MRDVDGNGVQKLPVGVGGTPIVDGKPLHPSVNPARIGNPLALARPSSDEYFMDMTHLVATRSTCLRRAVGALMVKDRHVLTTGYNGQPKNVRHASEIGCLREKMHVPSGTRHELCRGLHAEQNAIIQAAVFGVSISGATCYCTTAPCVVCAKMLINAGIERVVYEGDYPDPLAKQMMGESGLTVERWDAAAKKAVAVDLGNPNASLEEVEAEIRATMPRVFAAME